MPIALSTMLASTEMELTYAAYQERQLHEISPAGLAARAGKVGPAGQFHYAHGQWTPAAYPGHAVVSMVEAGRENASLAGPLRQCQQALLAVFPEPGVLYPLPAESFHQTIANTLSGDNHQRLVVATGRAADYPRVVAGTFPEFPPGPESQKIVRE